MSDNNSKAREYEVVQEDLEEVMRKYDRESNVRIWTGKPAIAVKCILIGFSLFCVWVTLFATFLEEIRLTSFMGMIILLGFLNLIHDVLLNRLFIYASYGLYVIASCPKASIPFAAHLGVLVKDHKG